jgi:hypothetical protein
VNDYLLIERVLLGTEPADKLDAQEREFCAKYKPAFEIGRMAGRLAQGYLAHGALYHAGLRSNGNRRKVAATRQDTKRERML